MDNWVEQYNSIRSNIQIASEELTRVLEDIPDKIKEIGRLNQEIVSKHREIAEEEARKDSITNEIRKEQSSLIQEKVALEGEGKELTGREREIVQKEQDSEDKINGKKVELNALTNAIQEKEVELDTLDEAKKKIVILKVEEKKVLSNIHDKEGKLSVVNDRIATANITLEKDVKGRKKRINSLDMLIAEKQASVANFKRNMRVFEEQMKEEAKNLSIYDGRLRTLYKQIGMPLRDMTLEVPTLNEKEKQ